MKLLIIFAAALEIPFTIVWKRLAELEDVTEDTEFDVATLPLTVEVKVLPERDKLLVVDEATTPERSRLDVTPLTFDVRVFPEAERVLFDTTLVVAITPFTFVVKTLPVTL